MHLKLKETIDNQIEETKLLKKELEQRNVDFEAVKFYFVIVVHVAVVFIGVATF